MLDYLISPISRAEFFRDYWTRNFLHVPGSPDKFAHLYPWDVLNRALEQNRFDPKRLSLVKSGVKLAPERYLNGAQVHARRLVNELSNGATLIFNACEEVYPPLRDLCIDLERLFHHHVIANLYAGWRTDNGFDVHWDTQDVLILQVSGRKRWKVWRPTRLYPFRDDVVDTSPQTRPTGEPVWDDLLQPGGLLNIPRGWWHVAYPADEPSLHLTVTVQNWNGIDLLYWLADQMKSSETARMELPIVATPDERKAWVKQVLADLTAACNETLIDRYLAGVDLKAVPRPCVSLPAEADQRQSALERTIPLQLAVPRPLHFSFQGETVFCEANGSRWQMDGDVAAALRAFNDYRPHTIAELFPHPNFRVTSVIGLMVMAGVLGRVPPPSDEDATEHRFG